MLFGCIAYKYEKLLRERAFSLIELMITLSISSVVTIFSISGYKEFSTSLVKDSSRKFVSSDIKESINLAKKNGAHVIIIPGASKTFYTIGIDSAPYTEASTPIADSTHGRRNLPEDVTIEISDPNSAKAIFFDSNGNLIDQDSVLEEYEVKLYFQNVLFLTININPMGGITYA